MLTKLIIAIPLIITTLTTISLTQILPDGCGPKFPTQCFCGMSNYDQTTRYIVNCTDTELRNTSILEFIPENTNVLIFTGNHIEELPWNVFGTINDYLSLNVVDMSNNHIHEIRGKSYHHVQNVKILILNHNNLSISRYDDEINHHHPRVFSNFINLEALHLTDAFADNTSAELSENLHDIFMNSNLTKLRKLHLEQNEISKFKDRNVFCDLPSLLDLYMGDNNLNEINFNVHCLMNLRFLDLERNNFEFVNGKDLKLLDELEANPNRTNKLIIDFGLNPFKCDCRLDEFKKWLQTTVITVRNKNNLQCMKSDNRTDFILSTELEECTVKQQPLSAVNRASDAYTITLVFLLVVLSFILFGLVATLIYLSREKIKYFVNPVLDTVSKKVHYTTIKDEECQEVHV